MAASPPCPICDTSHTSTIRAAGATLRRCGTCDFVWLDPLPGRADVAALYDDAYARASTGYFAKAEKKLARARRRLRQILKLLPGGAAGRTFLDVGCNGGFTVEAAREAGFAAFGVEPDPVSVAYARQHYPQATYVTGLIEEADFGGRRFDVVYCSEVIEHTPDPNRFVARLAEATAPGGILYLTTPDISHWRRPRDLARWDAFCPPSHCLYFSPRNLERLLAKHGFDVVRRRLALKPGIKLFARRRAA